MITLIILFGMMLCGYMLRKVRMPELPDRFMSYMVWALLFLFGISIGGNKELVSKLHSFGAVALAVAVATVCGSVIGGWLLWEFRSKV